MYEVKSVYKPLLFIIDFIGYFFFWWIKLAPLPKIKKILCIRIENIGDVVPATPAFRALKQRFPDAKIDVLTRSFTKEILEGDHNVDKVIGFDFPWLGLQGKNASWHETFKFINKLRKENYDLVIDFHADPRNILTASFIGKYRLGFGIRGFGFLLNKIVSFNKNQHQIQINLDLVRSLEADTDDKLDFFISKKDDTYAKKLLSSILKKDFVCISISAGRKEKYWITEYWSVLADCLIKKYGVKIVFTGTAKDDSDVKEVSNNMQYKNSVLNVAGRTSIKQLGAVIKHSKLFICPDSGPAHISRALNTPLIALFSIEDPERWGYNANKFRYICNKDMKNISVEDVLKVVKDLGVFNEI